jgi:predicted TIM-barrel fold metal-dependent hydrolase
MAKAYTLAAGGERAGRCGGAAVVRIDAFTHVWPERYIEKRREIEGAGFRDTSQRLPELRDLDARVRNMDEAGIDKQAITLAVPPVEQAVSDPVLMAELASVANESIADMAAHYPGRIIPVGVVPLTNADAAVREAERCIKQLGMAGIQICTNIAGRPLHDPELLPFFEYMANANRPIWMHPYFNPAHASPAYGLPLSIEQVFGWPFDSTVAMTSLIFGGVLDRFPTLSLITHHAGALIPFFEQRIVTHLSPEAQAGLKRPLLDYYRAFYVDTAVQGSKGALLASCSFYGADQMLFGTDTPYPLVTGEGKGFARETMASIDALPIAAAEKDAILGGNLQRLLGL